MTPVSCAICLDSITPEQAQVGFHLENESPSYHHIFHRTCINDWMARAEEAACPLCRQIVVYEPAAALAQAPVPAAPEALFQGQRSQNFILAAAQGDVETLGALLLPPAPLSGITILDALTAACTNNKRQSLEFLLARFPQPAAQLNLLYTHCYHDQYQELVHLLATLGSVVDRELLKKLFLEDVFFAENEKALFVLASGYLEPSWFPGAFSRALRHENHELLTAFLAHPALDAPLKEQMRNLAIESGASADVIALFA